MFSDRQLALFGRENGTVLFRDLAANEVTVKVELVEDGSDQLVHAAVILRPLG